ncbi:MAG: hypothetical protein ABFS08_07155 [Pseudomonadota bacterium]
MSHMNQPAITVIINNNTYSLSTSNAEAIHSIPNADRQQLIALLEVIKQQESAAQSPVRQATTETTGTVYNAGNPINHQAIKSERLASGDVDSIMAQLIMEEKSKQKPGLTKQTIYKWVVGVAIVIILLVLVL